MTTSGEAATGGWGASAAGAPATEPGRLPTLVIAGVTKAGTTSLFRYLSQHPQVCPSDEKELRHFLPLRYGEPLAPIETYTTHFRHWRGEPVVMEASPGYFYGGRDVAQAMAATLDDARVIISLREPGERCWSFFNFMRSRAKLPRDTSFEGWLDQAEELHRAGVDQRPEYHDRSGLGAGCYDQWMPAWLEAFGDRLRIEWFDDLSAHPSATVTATCRWLGIDAAPVAGFSYHVENKTRQFRNKRLQQAALRLNRANVVFFERHQGVKRAIRTAYYAVNRAPGESGMSPAARQRLDAFYAPHLARLAEMLPEGDLARAPGWVLGSEG